MPSSATTRPTRIIVEGRPPHEKILTQYSTDQPEVHEVIAEMRRVIDEFDASRPDRRDLSAAAPPRRLLRQRSRAARRCRSILRCSRRLWSARSIEKIIARLREGAAGGRLAELGARQPRSAAGGEPGRAGAGAGRRDAVADAAGHADTLLWRRDRHAPGRDRAGTSARSLREERAGHRRRPRRLPHADAMGCLGNMRLFDRKAVAAAGG